MKIGLFGSTGLIGLELKSHLKGLGHEVVPFSRIPNRKIGLVGYETLFGISDLSVIVNLIGGHAKNNPEVGQKYGIDLDALACEWSKANDRPYIYISSGAIFGHSFGKIVTSSSPFVMPPIGDSYTASKLLHEKRHSELRRQRVRVSDLRIFSYSGPLFIKKGNYFLSELMKAAHSGHVLEIVGQDFVRDYVGASELAQAILALSTGANPTAFNLFSAEPVRKSQILALFSERMGLSYVWSQSEKSAVDAVQHYLSEASQEIEQYNPRTSMETIRESVRDFSR